MKVTADALDFALAHVERYGDTDIFLPAFEFEAIRFSWKEVRSYLVKQDLDTWDVRPLRKYLSPKGKLGYRIATQLDPLDTLLFIALVFEVGNDIEQFRVPCTDNVVLSYRFNPDNKGRLYSKDYSYDLFRKQSLILANSLQDGWVVLTDIADFYLRLYLHPLENALSEAVPPDHARVILKFIKAWNMRVSYGIPVGPAASRILAELSIHDIDNILRDNGITYCRYSDDFRLFSSTKSQAFKHLALLAENLHNIFGLTLQEAKTEVITTAQFIERFHETDEQKTLDRLETNFYRLLENLGMDTYDIIEYEDLLPDQRKAVNQLNLQFIIYDQITRERSIDAALMRFVLRRLVQVDDITIELAMKLLSNIDKLLPVFKDIIAVVKAVLNAKEIKILKEQLIDSILELLEDPYLSHLDYYSAWILTLFEYEYTASFGPWSLLYSSSYGSLMRRELILAMGFASNQAWVRTNKRNVFEFNAWERRAFLRIATCLPTDEYKHWFRSIQGRLDVLDKWVIAWAKQNPIISKSQSSL